MVKKNGVIKLKLRRPLFIIALLLCCFLKIWQQKRKLFYYLFSSEISYVDAEKKVINYSRKKEPKIIKRNKYLQDYGKRFFKKFSSFLAS